MEYKCKKNGFLSEYRDDSFFDSLRSDYPKFNEWYDRSINDSSKTSHYWIENNKVKAFIGIKSEDEEIALENKIIPKKKRLKITTIKSEGINGFSEFFVYQAIKRACELDVKEIYFTVIPNNKNKKSLLEIAVLYGFKEIGKIKKTKNEISRYGEEVCLMKDLDGSGLKWKEQYPSLGLKTNPDIGIIVLKQEFHDNYIQDANLFGVSPKTDFNKMGIQKSYVHRQENTYKLPVGSIILIYRKGDKGRATFTGVVTGVGRITHQYKKEIDYNSFDEFKKKVKKRHAFTTEKNLSEWYQYGKYVTFFSLNFSFGKGKNVNLEYMKSIGLNNNVPIFNIKPTKEQFIKIFKKGRGGQCVE